MTSSRPRSFYHDKSRVRQYIEMREGLDGSRPIKHLRKFVENGSRVLEIGMGTGTDLLLLSKHFKVTGSDYSQHFIDHFREHQKGFDLRLIDAVTLETDGIFDCIFSNKVLHHLDDEQLTASFQRQTKLVRAGGILFHTFWRGDESKSDEGLVFRKHQIEFIREKTSFAGKFVGSGSYGEMVEEDSFFVAIRTLL